VRPAIALGSAAVLAALGVALLTFGAAPTLAGPSGAAASRQTLPATSGSEPPRSPTEATTTTPPRSTRAVNTAPSRTASSRSTSSTEPVDLAPGDGPRADATVQQLLERSQPPNLPTAQARALEQLGREVWLADVTGTGRQRWVQYFGAAGSSGYTNVRVQAAVAHQDSRGHVTITLLWAGTSPAGDPQIALPGSVLLLKQPTGLWEPTR
jgi:hypothetical protein